LILILAGAACVYLVRGRFHHDPRTRDNLLFFALFAGFTFWLSLSPDSPVKGIGPSLWLHSLISQIRVPARAGIQVHFALLMMTGFLLSSTIRWRKYLLYPGVFPALMIAGYPPLVQNIPLAPVRPAFTALQNGTCGAGLYFPFVNGNFDAIDLYHVMQRMRGTDCAVLNNMSTPSRIAYLAELFPPRMDYINRLPYDQKTVSELERLVHCVPLSWIVFDPAVVKDWREEMCRRLGWRLNPDLSCVSPNKGAPISTYPEACN
jgi:hypothetical protein